jgi:hypothetical protein
VAFPYPEYSLIRQEYATIGSSSQSRPPMALN